MRMKISRGGEIDLEKDASISPTARNNRSAQSGDGVSCTCREMQLQLLLPSDDPE